MTVEISDNFELKGDELQFEEVEAVKRRGAELVGAATDEILVDCGGLARANSVTVAAMLHWYRLAGLANKPIVFVNLAEELRNIVDFSGLSQVLAIKN